MSLLPSGAIETTGYDINNSLRFRSSASAYLNRTPASAGNRKTWTWSAWVKKAPIQGSSSALATLMGCTTGSTDSTYLRFGFYQDKFIVGNNSAFFLQSTPLYRDPSAWYHVVVSTDTTQGSASNRMRIYINGTEVTAWSTDQRSTYLTSSVDLAFNQASQHSIGSSLPNAGDYLDGYLTEVNFVDGSQLTPSSFGETDAITGVWKAKKYTGTYGTNGFYLPFKLNNTSTYAGSFNGSSQYLSAPDNTVFSWGTGSYTVECWIKTSTKSNYTCIAGKSNPAATDSWYIETDASGYIHYGGNGAITLQGTKDVCDGNWHHIAIVRNGSTNVTLYIDGISNVTASDTNAYTATGYPLTIGYLSSTYPRYFNGQISNFRIVKGAAVYTSNFVPSSTALTAISNTSILTLQNATIIDNSTNAFTITNNGTVTTSTVTPFVANIASDNSGNNNNWFTNNINYTTTGTTYDAMTDSPTLTSSTEANYAVMNPLWKSSNIILAGANLNVTSSGSGGSSLSTIAMESGKYYCELRLNSSTDATIIGIANSSFNPTTSTLSSANAVGYYTSNGDKFVNGTQSAYGASCASGDIVGIALDITAGTITFYKNNTSQGAITHGLTGPFYFATSDASSGSNIDQSWNFGQRPFAYTPPTGFKALNTYNLPDSTIKKGNTVMDATLYTGTGASLTVTNTGAFKPDFVWIKSRSVLENHLAYDSVRGTNQRIYPNLTTAESTATNQLNSFNSNGFTLGADPAQQANITGATFVAWQWQAGQGTNTTNTSGSITSTVSVNTTAGFSVATFTGNGTAGATIGHGLGVAPKMIIVKSRSATGDWWVYHASIGATKVLFLSLTDAELTFAAWNNTAPTSSVFTIGSAGGLNANGVTQVAYCWAEIAGFSKFGSYTGNNSNDGPFVYCGFRPKFVMIKDANTAGYWAIFDTATSTYNVTSNYLQAQSSAAEVSIVANIDFLSNGFKLRANNANSAQNNINGNTYIYMAFAESPFKNSLAR